MPIKAITKLLRRTFILCAALLFATEAFALREVETFAIATSSEDLGDQVFNRVIGNGSIASISYSDTYSANHDQRWVLISANLKVGHHFKYWEYSKTKDYTGEFYFHSYIYDANLKFIGTSGISQIADKVRLIAYGAPNTYTIRFDGNGATSGSMSDQEKTYGTPLTLSKNNFKKTGYTFLGWATEADKAKTYDDGYRLVSDLTTKDGDIITLYAKWKENANYYIEYKANGGSGEMDRQTMTFEVAANLTANAFTNEHHIFKGWATEPTGEVVYTDRANVNEITLQADESATITLYAVWEEHPHYTVTLSKDDHVIEAHSNPEDLTIEFCPGTLISVWGVPADGYTINYTESAPFSENISSDLTINIITTPIRYRVRFNPNGGSGESYVQDLTYDTAANLIECSFTKSGYEFLGWATTVDGDVIYGDKALVDENLTTVADEVIDLYAIWKDAQPMDDFTKAGLKFKADGTLDGEYITLSPASRETWTICEDNGFAFVKSHSLVSVDDGSQRIVPTILTSIVGSGTLNFKYSIPAPFFDEDENCYVKFYLLINGTQKIELDRTLGVWCEFSRVLSDVQSLSFVAEMYLDPRFSLGLWIDSISVYRNGDYDRLSLDEISWKTGDTPSEKTEIETLSDIFDCAATEEAVRQVVDLELLPLIDMTALAADNLDAAVAPIKKKYIDLDVELVRFNDLETSAKLYRLVVEP